MAAHTVYSENKGSVEVIMVSFGMQIFKFPILLFANSNGCRAHLI